MTDLTNLTIDSVCTKGSIYPILINFQNGYPSEDFETECVVLQDKDGTKTIATELAELVYAGKEEKEDLGQTMILARNRKTGKVRLIEVGCAELQPVTKIDLDATPLPENSRLELSRKFGSKKQKKQMEQQEKLKVNVQTVTEQMEKVTANVTVDKLDLSGYNKDDNDDFYVPPIDRQARRVEDVYSIDKILTEDEYERIYAELLEKGYMEDLHPYMKTYIKGKNLSPRLTVLAVYTSELFKFIPIKYLEVRKKNFVACNKIKSLNDILINQFTEYVGGKRSRPQHYKDKLTCHIIVFLLLLNNFKFELEPLCAAMKLTPMTLGVKVRLVGASVVNSGDKKMVHLKLPLVPKSSKPFSRRKSAKF